MTIRTQVKAGTGTGDDGGSGGGRLASNHSEALKVRSTLKAGKIILNHNGTLQVRSTLKARGKNLNHNESLRGGSTPAIAMLRQPRTTSRKEDRLELLVIRAGLRAGRRERGRSRR